MIFRHGITRLTGALLAALAFSAFAQDATPEATASATSQQLQRASALLSRSATSTNDQAKASLSGVVVAQVSADGAVAALSGLVLDLPGRYAVEVWATRSYYATSPSTFSGIPLGKKVIGNFSSGGVINSMWTLVPFSREVPAGYYPTLLVTRDDGTNNWPFSVALSGSTTLLDANSLTAGMFEFYAPSLNHFFITANVAEAANLADNPQLGWRPTGDVQIQFNRGLQGVGGASGVCRFYGHPTIGPNSHFYTADPGECNFLRQLQASTPFGRPRWNYEEIAFASFVPSFGQCPSGQAPIVRFYNNGAAANDSNHRYVSTQANFNTMAAAGWRNEGAVMCIVSALPGFDPSLYR